MDDRRFDELVRKVVSAGGSRRWALGAVAAVVGALGGVRAEEATAGKVGTEATCRGDFCAGDEKRCRGGGNSNGCVCYRGAEGGHVCAAPEGQCVRCRSDRDCTEADLRGFHCVRNGRGCCGGDRPFVCAAPCKATREEPEMPTASSEGSWGR